MSETSKTHGSNKLAKPFLVLAGVVTLILGFIGVILPILPTTPFLLISVICFANSSMKLHSWLIKSRIYNNTVEKFIRQKGMTLKTKLFITIPVGILLTCLFVYFDNIWIKVIIAVLFVIKVIVFIRIPTIKATTK